MKQQILNRIQLHPWRGWFIGSAVTAVLLVIVVIVAGRISPALHQQQRQAVARASISITMAAVAHTTRNIAYCGTHDRAQQLDLYKPKRTSNSPYPLVVFIHGGGWSQGNKADPIVSTYGPNLVKQGMALASLNYRLAPRYTYPIPNQDVSCALSYLYSNAGRYQLDSRRFALFGASAGGELAEYAMLSPSEYSQPWHASIRGAVDFYGATDLTDLRPQSHLAKSVQRFLGAGNASQAAAASPITYADQPAPPTLIFQGTRDAHVPPSQSQELAHALQASGNTVTLVMVTHAGHGFGLHAQPSVGQIRNQLTGFLSHVFSRSS